jgi:hypothetical protein
VGTVLRIGNFPSSGFGARVNRHFTGGSIFGAGTIKANTSVGNASGAGVTINVDDSGKVVGETAAARQDRQRARWSGRA